MKISIKREQLDKFKAAPNVDHIYEFPDVIELEITEDKAMGWNHERKEWNGISIEQWFDGQAGKPIDFSPPIFTGASYGTVYSDPMPKTIEKELEKLIKDGIFGYPVDPDTAYPSNA